tara:strand:+ start:228 stop:923 length:696 start_codon:yes stop_codon:yes gene_type:complete
MATFSSGSMHGSGTPGQELTGGTTYTFQLQNRDGQYPLRGAQYLVIDGNGLATQQAGGEPTSYVGPLKEISLPPSSPLFTTTVDGTFIFDVQGAIQGSRALIAITTQAGIFSTAKVQSGGVDFLDGDTITISQNDLQAAGFTNANRNIIFDVFPNYIAYIYPTNTTITGVFGGFLNSITSNSLTTSSIGWGIEMPDSGSIGGAFEFTPTTTIPQDSYAIRSTGHFELTIAP